MDKAPVHFVEEDPLQVLDALTNKELEIPEWKFHACRKRQEDCSPVCVLSCEFLTGHNVFLSQGFIKRDGEKKEGKEKSP